MYKHEYEIVFESGYRIRRELFEDLEDIKRYFYEKKYSREYDSLGRYLEQGSAELLKDIEDKWMHNKLDTDKIYKEKDIYMYHANNIALDLYFRQDEEYDFEGDEYYYDNYAVADAIILE